MKRLLTALLLILFSLACTSGQVVQDVVSVPVSTPTNLPASPSPSPTPQPRMVCVEYLNLRAAPGITSGVVAVLSGGQPVTLTEKQVTTPDGGGWAQVQAAGKTGWLNLKYLCKP